MLTLLLLLAGFILLIYGADKMVDGASSLANKYNIPHIIIGLTIVAFGTSSPELVVNIIASVNNNSEIVLGNILGSSIFNILVILGLSALVYPLRVKSNTTWIEIPLSALSAILVLILANDIFLDGSTLNFIGRSEGIVLLCFFIVFLVYNLMVIKADNEPEEIEVNEYTKLKSTLFIVLGFAGLIIGGRLIVSSAVTIAEYLDVSDRIIALTVLSIGTSLPELATSIIAARKKNVDIAIGNVVGSNIFNMFLVLGTSTIVNPVKIESNTQVDIMVNVLASILLFVLLFIGKKRHIERWEGCFFILIYAVYLGYLINTR